MDRIYNFFKSMNMEDRIIYHDASTATIQEAAIAVGVSEAEIAKTLSFILKDGPILIVVAGDAKIDNPKYKNFFGEKAKMIDRDHVKELIGHDVGGVCPFCINENVKVYYDRSLKRFKKVYTAAGTANSSLEVSPEELEKIIPNEGWVNVCKGWK